MSDITKDVGELLREHRGGLTLRDASREFGELIDAVLELDATGTMTVKIVAKPQDEGSSVSVTVDVVAAPPKPPLKASATFYARGGTLVPFEEPAGADRPEVSPETQSAMAVSSLSDAEDRAQARSTS